MSPPSPPGQLPLLSTRSLLATEAASETAAAWCFISPSPWQLAYSLTQRDPYLASAINQPPACVLGRRRGSLLVLRAAGSIAAAIPAALLGLSHAATAELLFAPCGATFAPLKQSLTVIRKSGAKKLVVFPVCRQTGATHTNQQSAGALPPLGREQSVEPAPSRQALGSGTKAAPPSPMVRQPLPLLVHVEPSRPARREQRAT